MRRLAIATSFVARQRKHVVLLLNTNMRSVRLIMSSSCITVVRRWSLLTRFVHREHRSTMRTIGKFRGLYVDLYLLTGSLVLIIIHSVINIGRKFTLRVLPGFRPRSTKGPGVPESCAHIARSGAHV